MATDVSSAQPLPTPRGTQGKHVSVREVMRPAVTTVEMDAHLAGATYLMKHNGATALLVMDDVDPSQIRAILTDTDVAQAVGEGRNPEETRIRDLVTESPISIGPDTSVEQAARLMLANRFHHLPVVDGMRLLGIVELTDVCRPFFAADAEDD
jgi:CBS domain-containing protein